MTTGASSMRIAFSIVASTSPACRSAGRRSRIASASLTKSGTGRGTALEVGVGVALAVEQRLPLPDHARGAVVDDRDLDRGCPPSRRWRAPGWSSGSSRRRRCTTRACPARPSLAPIAAGHGEAHRAEAAGVDPGVRGSRTRRTGWPTSGAGRRPRRTPRPVRRWRRSARSRTAAPAARPLAARSRAGRSGASRRSCAPPGRVVAAVAGVVLGLHGGDELGDDLARVAHDGHVGDAVLGDLRRVDVGVDDRRRRARTSTACR